MLGVILCGGHSLRMGSDKGLLHINNTTWTQYIQNTIAALQIPAIVSVNSLQLQNYRSLFSTGLLVEDNNAITIYGPLKGIMSVHLKFPAEDLLVIACDMIKMQPAPLMQLLKSMNDTKDAFVFMNNEHPEPLCAVYTAKALNKIYSLYSDDRLQKHSLLFALEQLNTCYLEIPDEWKDCFNNYNSKTDLAGL